MKTNDIMRSLALISPSQMPPSLVAAIHERLTEGDEAIELLRAVVNAANQYEEIAPPIVEADKWLFENVESYQ